MVTRFDERTGEPESLGSTRRGFLQSFSRPAAVAATLLAGGTLGAVARGARNAEANVQCCAGAYCGVNGCPPNSSVASYSPTMCCDASRNEYFCYDCLSTSCGDYVCTYTSGPLPNCPQGPAP